MALFSWWDISLKHTILGLPLDSMKPHQLCDLAPDASMPSPFPLKKLFSLSLFSQESSMQDSEMGLGTLEVLFPLWTMCECVQMRVSVLMSVDR